MAQNFGSNFLRGFQPNFANMFNTSYRTSAIEDERERERQEKLRAQQEQASILSQLFKGTKSVPIFENRQVPLMDAGQSFINKEVPLSPQEKFDLRAKLSISNALSFLDSQNKPNEYLAPNLGKFPTIHVWNKTTQKLEDTGQPDPYYEEPLIESSEWIPASNVKGLERWKGYDVEQKVWIDKDGNVVKRGQFGNPIKPTYSQNRDGSNKVYDLSAYKEKIGVYEKREAELNSKIEKYKSERINDIDAYNKGLEKIGVYGNAINKAYDKEEIAFYNDLLPEAKQYINENFYQPLKESGITSDVAYQDRQGIFNDYVADLIDDYKKGKIKVNIKNYKVPEGVSQEKYAREVEAEIFRSALLWGKLKFRRL